MKLPKGKIERLAVAAVTDAANAPGYFLVPDIPVGDKEISFDGKITVFHDDSERKESFKGNISVQVKGTQVDQFSDGRRTFSPSMAHLQNFFKNEGAILFVVEVKNTGETKIFYKALLPTELFNITKRFSDQKTCTIELRPLKGINLYQLCNKFLQEQKKQPTSLVKHKPFSWDYFSQHTMSSITFDQSAALSKSIFNHEFTFYGVMQKNLFPLHYGRVTAFHKSGKVRFNPAEGEAYTVGIELRMENEKTIVRFEDVFFVIVDEKNNTLEMGSDKFHSLQAHLQAIPLIFHLFDGQELELEDGGFISLGEEVLYLKEQLNFLHEHLTYLNTLKKVFSYLHIPENTVFDDKDDSLPLCFDILIEAVLYNQIDNLMFPDPKRPTLGNLEVGNKTILLFYIPDRSPLFCYPFSDEMLKMHYLFYPSKDSEPVKQSIYHMLDEESLAYGVNIDMKRICESFDQFDPFANDVTASLTISFCLRCLSAFDISGKVELLEAAQQILDRYMETELNKDSKVIVLINRYQIKVRKIGFLNNEDNKCLYQLKLNSMENDDLDELFCINVLLKNKFEAELHFSRMTEERQNSYLLLPIFYLYEKL
ncbi:hypothetical protein YDYSY3_38920 [Paenibacillus chitinolyticus]|uniref:hypothetical protein n=1 Tax=Paenibacillus chitinolyticus TaxID=79263 RepID=UPI0026E4BEAE|nr:hypothetical protein [Paenibacillus chitinolyticus]GKS12892.1 hypothetical protein YDYSY3_38920 [Paenibacillus chitinolyticus]